MYNLGALYHCGKHEYIGQLPGSGDWIVHRGQFWTFPEQLLVEVTPEQWAVLLELLVDDIYLR